MATRKTMTQRAEAAIKKQLLEGSQAQFFRGWGENIVCADPGDLLAVIAESLAGMSRGILVTVTGGKAVHWDAEDWQAQLIVFENPKLNRPGDGKTSDAIRDAVEAAFRDGGAFWPVDWEAWADEDRELYGFAIAGTCTVAPVETANPGGEC